MTAVVRDVNLFRGRTYRLSQRSGKLTAMDHLWVTSFVLWVTNQYSGVLDSRCDCLPLVSDSSSMVTRSAYLNRVKYDTVIELLRSHPRPVTLTFRRSSYTACDGSFCEYVITHAGGGELEGIDLVQGGSGDQAVVASVDSYAPKAKHQRVPRVGAAIVAVNGHPCDSVGCAATRA